MSNQHVVPAESTSHFDPSDTWTENRRNLCHQNLSSTTCKLTVNETNTNFNLTVWHCGAMLLSCTYM